MKYLASLLGAIFALILLPASAAAQCSCAQSSLMNTQVATQAGGTPALPSTVTAGVELPNAGPAFGMAGPSGRMNVNYGSNTIRVDFTQLATYGANYVFNFTNLNPTPPAGCAGAPKIVGITVQTNKAGVGFVSSGATFGPHSVTVPFTGSTNIDWNAGEFILVTLQYGCDVAPTGGFDSCCPPWNSQQLQSMLSYQGTGGIAAPYTLKFNPTVALHNQMNAYINYLKSLPLGFTGITLQFQLFNAGNGAVALPGLQVGPTQTITWTGVGSPPANFFPNGAMSVNMWYRIQTTVILTGGPGSAFLPEKCRVSYVDVRIQTVASLSLAPGAARGGAAPAPARLQIRLENGEVIERTLDRAAIPPR